MKAVQPYTPERANGTSEGSARAEFPNLDRLDVSYSLFDYWKLFRSLWESQEDFVIVEHDMLVPPGAAESFASCPELWCTYEYALQEGLGLLRHGLGLVRFRKALPEQFPEVLLRPLTWERLDVTIACFFEERGIVPHVHGEAEHLHEYTAPSRWALGNDGKIRQLSEDEPFITSFQLTSDGQLVET